MAILTCRACSTTQSVSMTIEAGASADGFPPLDPFLPSLPPPPPVASDLREQAGPPSSVGGVGMKSYTSPRSEVGFSLPMTSPTCRKIAQHLVITGNHLPDRTTYREKNTWAEMPDLKRRSSAEFDRASSLKTDFTIVRSRDGRS